MKLDIAALSAPPIAWCKLGAFGLEKRGKTTLVLKVACMLARHTGKRIALLDTENMRTDWYDRVLEITGQPPICFPAPDDQGHVKPCSPEDALAFAKACEEHPDVAILVCDSMTELLNYHREGYVKKNGKGIPLNLYSKLDAPYKRFGDWVKTANMHVLATMREGDDRQTVDDVEQVIGKTGKAGKFEYIPRIMAHCTIRKSKGANVYVTEVRDCSREETLKIEKKDGAGAPKSSELEPIISRFLKGEVVA